MVHCDYFFSSVDNTIATFEKKEGKAFLQPRKEVRIIGKENGIPLLACTNVQGAVKEVRGNKLLIDLRDLTSAARAREQVFNLPLIIIPDAINLTRRMLEPLHKFHRLAADMMLPTGLRECNSL
ncbi:MAG TPA: hypothetical protein VKA95_00055 [Nitrososphaeraceae archaeon]|nr:hypothetical protein [Nitrososphaeraceae archaeon]